MCSLRITFFSKASIGKIPRCRINSHSCPQFTVWLLRTFPKILRKGKKRLKHNQDTMGIEAQRQHGYLVAHRAMKHCASQRPSSVQSSVAGRPSGNRVGLHQGVLGAGVDEQYQMLLSCSNTAPYDSFLIKMMRIVRSVHIQAKCHKITCRKGCDWLLSMIKYPCQAFIVMRIFPAFANSIGIWVVLCSYSISSSLRISHPRAFMFWESCESHLGLLSRSNPS